MKDDKNTDNYPSEDILLDDEFDSESEYDPEDRFTTQDIDDIEKLLSDTDFIIGDHEDTDSDEDVPDSQDLVDKTPKVILDTSEEDDELDDTLNSFEFDSDSDESKIKEPEVQEESDLQDDIGDSFEFDDPEDLKDELEQDLDSNESETINNEDKPLDEEIEVMSEALDEPVDDFKAEGNFPEATKEELESDDIAPISPERINKELENREQETTSEPTEISPENTEEEIPLTVGSKEARPGNRILGLAKRNKEDSGDSSNPEQVKVKQKGKGLPKKRKTRPWVKTLGILVIVVCILGAIGAGGVYLLYTANFTDISNTKYTPKEKTQIYSADNVLIASIYSENRNYVSIDQVPQDLKNALVATEDSRFYTHNGVDYIGVVRALISNLLSGNSTGQGASTITQQLSRLLYLPDISTESTFLDSLNRKFKEISISWQMEDKYTKDQILEMYLNEYYFGSAAYGIDAAAQTYFGKSVSDLNLAESAMLAGLPQAPSIYAPNVNFDAAKQRQQQVLNRMVANGYITQQQADEAYNTPINIVPWSETDINNQIEPGYQDYVGKVLYEYAKTMAPSIMKERGLSEDEAITYARHSVASGGYKFYTTINTAYQQDAIMTMENSLDSFGYAQSEGYTGALVTVDRDGAVRAYYGGNEEYSDIDMASSPRQPGSNIKPIYYAMALERGVFQPQSVLNDAPININGYTPHNSDGGYSGPITFTQSLVNSKNVTSVQIFNTLGTQAAVDWIKQFGFDSISDEDYNLASALGGFTYGVKPYQMAAAFNTFNDNGIYNQAYFFDRVTTSNGDLVLDKNGLGLMSVQLVSPQTAQGMWAIMQQVVTAGTGTSAQCGLPTAGKTGTTDNRENLWFTGMTGNLTTSIWMGNLDYHVIGGGSYLPASIYGSYMRTLINNGFVS